jgi:hypothetical protein
MIDADNTRPVGSFVVTPAACVINIVPRGIGKGSNGCVAAVCVQWWLARPQRGPTTS